MMPRNSFILYTTLTLFCFWEITLSDPGINLLGHGCGPTSTNLPNLYENLNKTFGEIRTEIDDGKHFVTAKESTSNESLYSMLQCRDYMSKEDCLACFNSASVQIRNCSAAIGARVIYDGCFFRYETSNDFYQEGTTSGVNYQVCGNRTAPSVSAKSFATTVAQLAGDLRLATPKTKEYFAASKREVVGVPDATVYAIAQCVRTINTAGCQACMEVAFTNIQKCLPNLEGRAVDSGCFMRYADTPFFPDNQNTTGKASSSNPSSSSKGAPTGGVPGGGGLIILLLVAYFAW